MGEYGARGCLGWALGDGWDRSGAWSRSPAPPACAIFTPCPDPCAPSRPALPLPPLQAFSSWIHITAVRLFVESILRYGLPPQFLAALMRPNPKMLAKLRKVGLPGRTKTMWILETAKPKQNKPTWQGWRQAAMGSKAGCRQRRGVAGGAESTQHSRGCGVLWGAQAKQKAAPPHSDGSVA